MSVAVCYWRFFESPIKIEEGMYVGSFASILCNHFDIRSHLNWVAQLLVAIQFGFDTIQEEIGTRLINHSTRWVKDTGFLLHARPSNLLDFCSTGGLSLRSFPARLSSHILWSFLCYCEHHRHSSVKVTILNKHCWCVPSWVNPCELQSRFAIHPHPLSVSLFHIRDR